MVRNIVAESVGLPRSFSGRGRRFPVRAVGFTRYGGPEVLGLVDLPAPEPGEGEIRIRVAAATVNPSDTLFRSGGLAALVTGEWPYVAGLELAGVVDAAGPNARSQAGDRVAAMTRFIPDGRGAHAELVVVHGDSAAEIPDGLGLVEAATVPMNGLTVRLAYDTLGLAPATSSRSAAPQARSVATPPRSRSQTGCA